MRNVHAAARRALDEEAHDIVGVIGVTDAIGAAQQHLGQDFGRLLAHERQPLPRVLVEKAHGDVEGRAAPAFEREQLRQPVSVGRRSARDVVGAHARGEQRLMRVAHGRVGDEDSAFGLHPLGEAFRPQPLQRLAGSLDGGLVERGRFGRAQVRRRLRPPACFRMRVDRDVGDIGEQLGCRVLALAGGEEFRGLVDEAGGVALIAEFRMVEHCFEKGEIGGDAANAIFP